MSITQASIKRSIKKDRQADSNTKYNMKKVNINIKVSQVCSS